MSSRIVVSAGEKLILPLLWTGGGAAMNYDITLAEPGASVRIVGLMIGRNDSAANCNIVVNHAAPQTTSEVTIKTALSGNSSAEITGLVKVQPGAKGSKAWFAANILLSDKATGQAVPSLEILENDVSVGHAATVGRISNDEVFYLMSRGLSREAATKLIISGFLQDIIDKLPPELALRAQKELDS